MSTVFVQPSKPRRLRLAMLIVLMGIAIGTLYLWMPVRTDYISFEKFQNLYDEGVIERDSVVISEASITALRAGASTGRAGVVRVQLNGATRGPVAAALHELTSGNYTSKTTRVPRALLYVGLVLLLLCAVVLLRVLFWRAAGGSAGMLGNFGKSRHRTLTKEVAGVTFKDIAGIDEAKEQVSEIIEFLKNPKRFTRIGARIPCGVLLTGDPGCGKTLLAQAIAGEADVPFFSISGSDFVEMFAGVGASRVRDLFKQAKESAPCIIFLDEIDAVGRRRGGGFSNGVHGERDQTLNALLVEMDGFISNYGVIVIAATNRGDALDPALTRPGRFDRVVQVPSPDLIGRLEILKVHAKAVKLGPDIDLQQVADLTVHFTGADLAKIIREAAVRAAVQNKDFVEQEDLLEEAITTVYGPRSSIARSKVEIERLSYYQAGGALWSHASASLPPMRRASILRGGAIGRERFAPLVLQPMSCLKARLALLLSGSAAERIRFGDTSAIGSHDLAEATLIAQRMVRSLGMGYRTESLSIGFENQLADRNQSAQWSARTQEKADEDTGLLLREAAQLAEALLNDNQLLLDEVASALIECGELTGEEVAELIERHIQNDITARRRDGGRALQRRGTDGAEFDKAVLRKPTVSDLLSDLKDGKYS